MASQQKTNIIEINLLPSEFRQKRLNLSWLLDGRVMWSAFVLLILALALFVLYSYVIETTRDLKNAVEQTRQAVEKERPLLEKIKELNSKLAVIEQKSNALRSIEVSRKRWVILFEDLSTALPPGTWITGISQSSDKIEINCSTWNFSEVALYMLKLEQKTSITEVSLASVSAVKVNTDNAYSFSLKVGFNSNLGLETGIR